MLELIVALIVFSVGYYLGAKYGLPKVTKEDKIRKEEIKGFFALLKKGDMFYSYAADEGRVFNSKVVQMEVLANDPLLEAMEIKDTTFSFNDPIPVTYDDSKFRDVVTQNVLLIQEKLK